ncbi:MAG: hypothetical protein IKH82_05390 [Clostridiales bacterium]|nr:hypothetical protein [Clostridiales bacterium]MBR6987487.1 hypothetical protein [Clostridiales bacterium]
MMTHAQLKMFITEAILLFVLGAAIVIGGYFISSDNAYNRIQTEYQSRFSMVLDATVYEKVKSKALNDFPEIDGVYIGYDENNIPKGYVVDLVVESSNGQDLSMLVALDYESTRISGLALNPAEGENAFAISDEYMELIKDKLIGKQIPIAFVSEEEFVVDDNTEKITLKGLKDGVYYAQRLFDDRNRYIDYVEIEVVGGEIAKVKWDAFSTDKTNQDRSEASLKGAYITSGLDWATQSYNLCHALLECQDPDRLAMKSDGTTDIVDGVTCDIRPFVELVQECIENSRAGYTKDDYMRGLDAMLVYLYEKDAAELEYINADDHVVFSFEENPEIYTVYNDDEVAVGYKSVRLIEAELNGTADTLIQDPVITPAETNEDDQNIAPADYDSSEDGLTPGGDAENQIITDSIDDLPMSEMASFVQPVSEAYDETRTVIRACNTCYKFLKEYLNWKVN